MSQEYNKEAIRGISRVTLCGWIVLLLLHFYIECYPAFSGWGWSSEITDRLLGRLLGTGLFSPFLVKGLALTCMVVMAMIEPGMRDWELDKQACIWRIVVGGMIYFGAYWLFDWRLSVSVLCFGYALLTFVGIWLCYIGLSALRYGEETPLSKNGEFGEESAGFRQEEKKIETSFSMHLPAQYKYKGKVRKSWINLINPRRGILILGSPGSGKSWFIIESLIRQWIEKGNALFLYDFKYDALTKVAYHYFLQHRAKFKKPMAFYSINFGDISRSHRCNLIHPSTLNWISDAQGISRTILLSMNPTWIDKQGDFFVESPVNFLAALIWFLRQYKEGMYCTLPHVIELAQVEYEKLFPVLGTNEEIASLINPFREAWKNKTFKMLDGQIASARIPLARLSSPELYYILTGDDVRLDINNPSSPKIFCLGGDPVRQDALAPILSLFIDRINKICNRPGQHPCAMVCDEFATVRAYSMATTIATGRAHNIVPILAVQDISQLRTNYTRNEADLFLNTAGNLLCGQVAGETAKWISERFQMLLKERMSIGSNSEDVSTTVTQHWEPSVTAAAIGTLSSGEFVGVVADDPDRRLNRKIFHSTIVRKEPEMEGLEGLPVVREVDEKEMREGFIRVKRDVEDLKFEVIRGITENE